MYSHSGHLAGPSHNRRVSNANLFYKPPSPNRRPRPTPAPVREELAFDPALATPVPATPARQALSMIENIHTRAPFTRGYDREYVPKIVNGKRTFVHKDSPEVIVWVDQDRDQDNRN